ncbi:MAG: hypothetical protein FWE22_06765 [Firmicutes bacterium]|nr:hypothetical protein [Bacillota bacterium]
MQRQKSKKRIKTIIVIALVLLMLSTVGITFAFWSAGVSGAEADNNLTVNIGTGQTVSTQLRFSDSTTPDLALVPFDITARSNETNEIRFDIDVFWEGTGETGDDLNGVNGVLNIELNTIMIGSTNFAGVAGRNGQPLFRVQFEDEQAIVGNDAQALVVTIIITMDQTSGPAQYAQIAGQEAVFGFRFWVD